MSLLKAARSVVKHVKKFNNNNNPPKNAIAKTDADFFLILEKIRFNSTHNWKCCECLLFF